MPSTAEVMERVTDLESRVSLLENNYVSHRNMERVYAEMSGHHANLATLNRTVIEMDDRNEARFAIVHKKIDQVRTEMRTEFGNVRTEMAAEFSNVRTEFADVRSSLDELRDGLAAILTRLPAAPSESEDRKPSV